MFYAGNGARGLAFDAGMTIDQTLIGSMLDSMGAAVPRPVWQLASATFAANATEPAAAIILYAGQCGAYFHLEHGSSDSCLAWNFGHSIAA